MSFIICKRIISGKYFHLVRLNYRTCFELHTAQPALVRGVLLDKTLKSSSASNVQPGAPLPKEMGPTDFFGIESDDGVIHVNDKAPCGEKPSDVISSSSTQERFLRTTFGNMRFDSDNEPRLHGQFEESMADTTYSYGTDALIEKIQNVRTTRKRKRRGINKLEKFYAVMGNEMGVKESSVDLHKAELPVSENLSENNDGVFAKSEAKETGTCRRTGTERDEIMQECNDLGFIDRQFFGDEIQDIVGSSCVSQIAAVDRREEFCVEQDLAAHGACGDKVHQDEVREGQSSPVKLLPSTKESGYVDSICFGDLCDVERLSLSSSETQPKEGTSLFQEKPNQPNDHVDSVQDPNISLGSSFIDSLYFGAQAEEGSSVLRLENSPAAPENENVCKDMGSIYKTAGHGNDLANSALHDTIPDKGMDHHLTEFNLKVEGSLLKQSHLLNVPEFETDFHDSLKSSKKTELKKLILTAERKIRDLEAAFRGDTDTQLSNEVEQKTAYNYVLKLRNPEVKQDAQAGGEVSSKGYKTLKNQIPDLSRLTRSELLNLLKSCVLFLNDDIVIFNKPYNLVVHESKTTKVPSLSSVLSDLACKLDTSSANPQLYTVHRLDKETTGCLLLARNELAAQRLKALFVKQEIEKQYLVVTSRVPDPFEGVIEIPIAEGKIEDKVRMVLQPDIPKGMKYRNHVKHGKKAVTYYRVISTSENAALVEVRPETGIKHQIRVHLGFGLSCPILGDHKYSHLTKLAPQRLSRDILRKLEIRQSKVRHIPMYIHAQSVRIPKFLGKDDLFISAPLPEHMLYCLKKLKFKKS